MKFKRTVFLTAVIVALGLLLGAATARAQPTLETQENWVTAIRDLQIGGGVYDVEFQFGSIDLIYGGQPTVYDFTTQEEACGAVTAVNLALTRQSDLKLVGPTGTPTREKYFVPYVNQGFEALACAGRSTNEVDFWLRLDSEKTGQVDDPKVFAKFTFLGEDQGVTIGGTVNGLEGGGLVLQNNGADNLPIDGNGAFEFGTPLNPGDSYDVTVFTQPEGQTCSVANGIGVAPEVDVTDVVVSCVSEPATVGGTIEGMQPLTGVTLSLISSAGNSGNQTFNQNGPFQFSGSFEPGEHYSVTVVTNPANQTCSVENGIGVFPDQGNVDDILVSCDFGEPPPEEPVVLRDCPGGAIVGGVYSAIVLTEYEDCVINGVVVTGERGVEVRNPRLFSLINSFVKGGIRVIRDNKSLEPSTATIVNNVIDGGNLVIRELDEADAWRNIVYDGNIQVIDDQRQTDQYAEVIGNRIKGGDLQVNYNLSADVKDNSALDGRITCYRNLALDSSGNEADNGVNCGN